MSFTALSYGAMVRAFPAAGSTFTYAREVVRAARRLPRGLVAAARLPVPADDQLPGHRPVPARRVRRRPRPQPFIVVAIAAATILNVVGIESIARANIAIITAQVVFVDRRSWSRRSRSLRGAGHRPVGSRSSAAPRMPPPGVDPSQGLGPARGGGGAVPVVPRLRRRLHAGRGDAGTRRDIPRAILWVTLVRRADLHPAVLPRPPGVADAAVPARRGPGVHVRRHGGHRCHRACRRRGAAHVLRRRLRGGSVRVGAHLAGLGLPHPLHDGTATACFRAPSSAGSPRASGRPVPAILLVSACRCWPCGCRCDLLASMISFGALVAFSVVNLAVIKH